jgi:putative phosphoesterase
MLAVVELAIIGDTHMPKGARALPPACVERLAAADAILHTGDLMTLGVLEALMALGPPVHAVHGNVDDAATRARLPETLELELGGVRIAMVHDAGPAAGRLARLRRRFPHAGAVVFGHSHIPLHEEGGGLQIFNPGSPTERRRQPHHTMGLARVDGKRIVFEHLRLDQMGDAALACPWGRVRADGGRRTDPEGNPEGFTRVRVAIRRRSGPVIQGCALVASTI